MQQPTPNDLNDFLDKVRPAALKAGILEASFAEWTSDLEPDERVVQFSASQPEHAQSVGDYINTLVNDARIARGRGSLRAHENVLSPITEMYGVPASVLMAIWGIESNYGTQTGSFGVLRSLATLAAMGGRRRTFWTDQFVAALSILQQGDVAPNALVGSWAAAMGQTQFMPTTYLQYAIDFDSDGRRDIWHSVADSLASAANYLEASGWTRQEPWGWEVELPSNFDYRLVGEDAARPSEFWIKIGIELPATVEGLGSHDCTLVLPAGSGGPSFLTTANFKAILAYNNATAYALAVGHLADRISGDPSLRTAWPREEPLSADERRELQQQLVALGYDTGGVDGILGRATRRAVQIYQQRCNLVPDGYPGRVVLEELRRTR